MTHPPQPGPPYAAGPHHLSPHQPGRPTSLTPMAMSCRVLVGAMVFGVLVMLLALYFVLGTSAGTGAGALLLNPATLKVVGGLVLGSAVLFALMGGLGYRASPLPLDLPADQVLGRTARVWWAGFMLRYVLCGLPMLASIMLAFLVFDSSYLVPLAGAGCTLLLALVHVWPRRGPVDRVASRLEASGRASGLREGFGFA